MARIDRDADRRPLGPPRRSILSLEAGGGGVALALGLLLGAALELPAYMSGPRRLQPYITAPDPNYASYLRVIASLGPPPGPRRRTRRAAPPAWTEAESTTVTPVAQAREPRTWWVEEPGAQPAEIVVYEPAQRDRPPPPVVYYRRAAPVGDEPEPPPPPRPALW